MRVSERKRESVCERERKRERESHVGNVGGYNEARVSPGATCPQLGAVFIFYPFHRSLSSLMNGARRSWRMEEKNSSFLFFFLLFSFGEGLCVQWEKAGAMWRKIGTRRGTGERGMSGNRRRGKEVRRSGLANVHTIYVHIYRIYCLSNCNYYEPLYATLKFVYHGWIKRGKFPE